MWICFLFFRDLWNESFCSLIILPLDENFDIKYFFMMMIRTKEIAKESSVYGAQFKRMCIAVIFCILTMHCVSFVVLSPSLRRFHEKRPYQEGKISSLERVENWKIWGSNHHLPPPHPLLIDSLLSINDSCLPCGNNICLIRMFIWTDVWLHKK